jgi:hypothetical protein
MKKILVFIFTVVFVFQSCIITRADEATDKTAGSSSDSGLSLEGLKDLPDYNFKFESVAKNSEAELLVDKSVNNLRLILKDGKYFDTKVLNGQSGNTDVKNLQKSDFTVTYYNDKVNGTTTTLDNYTMSIALKQVTYTPIENGIRCTFVVGEADKLQLNKFPMYISKNRMENLVLKYLSKEQRDELLDSNHGYYTETVDSYVRNWDPGRVVGMPRLRKMYNFFYEVGKYTEDELNYDNQAYGIEEESTNISLTVVIDYLLDGKDLVVRVPVKDIVSDSRHPVSDLMLTPYLLSGDIYDKGYLFVPDGSGGIINFNSGNTNASVLSIPIYGADILKNSHFYTEQFIQSTLPVVGIVKNDTAILGIIEEGAELATVNANISGRMDEFNKINVKFNLLYMEKMPLTVGFGNVMPKYANTGYKGNITMRYKVLEGENASYTGMAKAYKSYLKQKGVLKKNPVPENSPLFVDMIASVPVEKNFMGIPYTTYKSMTSFSQAKNILESLKDGGIKDIVLQYTDWANGGQRNTPLTRVNVIRSIGGKKGLSEFISYTKKEGIEFFPEIKPLTTYSTQGIRENRAIARLINNKKATLPSFNIATRQTNRTREWLISPDYLKEYTDKILKGTGKLNIENLAVANAGSLLYGDYNNKHQLLRSDALPLFNSALDTLSQKRKLLFSNGNSYAFAYASYIEDLPTYSSGRRIIDYTVPFVQMVLENDVPYSMEAFNNGSMQDIKTYLLKAIETKSNLKWIFTNEDESGFAGAYLSRNFNMQPYFQVSFKHWKDKIDEYYSEYNTFYQKVKDAEVKNHVVYSDDLVKVEYTNGVKVYINYGSMTQTVDGQTVSPLSYITKE